MTERLKYQGRLAEKEMEAKKLRLRLTGLRDSLRDNLDPFVLIEDLNGELIAEEALEFTGTWAELRAVLATIDSIKNILGK
ncbi:MAG: hypothetical protein SV375_00040 [Thermodesulfobacteriota bacterium]|nr:hypothetical protein [Thermodesulfobacteriota bacterium]